MGVKSQTTGIERVSEDVKKVGGWRCQYWHEKRVGLER